MKRVAFLINPSSGSGSALQAAQAAKRSLWGWPQEFLYPESPQALRALCAGLDPERYEAAVVLGGDGTLNQVLSGLTRSQVPLYPFPAGTANDLAAELGIARDWDQAQRLLDQRAPQAIDLIEVNGIPFATVAGTGVGAVTTAAFNRRRGESRVFRALSRRLHSEIYTALGAGTLLFRRDFLHSLQIKSDVFDERLDAAAVFVCNQANLGGSLQVAPTSRNNDHKFNVLIVPKASTPKLLRVLAELRMGRHPRELILFSTDRLLMRDLKGRAIRVFGDGETLTQSAELDFRIRPQAIRVYAGRTR